jgi:hypothetical protein
MAVCEDYLGMCTELSLLAVTQYAKYNFDGMCKLGDVYLGCNGDGIFELTGGKDNATDIDAFFELPATDFGSPNQKRIRRAYLGYEADGQLVLEFKYDDNNVRRYPVNTVLKDLRQHGGVVPIGRDGKGRYWGFKIENVNGSDFSVDSIDVSVMLLGKKPGKV